MALSEDFHDMVKLAKMVISDRKAEKKKEEDARNTVQLECPYCGSKSRIVWKEGSLPKCPHCGAAYSVSEEELKRLAAMAPAPEAPKVPWHVQYRKYLVIGAIITVMLLALVAAAALYGGDLSMKGDAGFEISFGKKPAVTETLATEQTEAEPEP